MDDINLSLSDAAYRTLSASGMLAPARAAQEQSVTQRALGALTQAATEVELLDAFSRIRSLMSKGPLNGAGTTGISKDDFDEACQASKVKCPGPHYPVCRAVSRELLPLNLLACQ